MDSRFTDLNLNMLFHVGQSMSLGSKCEQAWHKPSAEPQVREAQAIIATQADVKEDPDSYVLVIDMPGLKLDDIKVEMEYGDMLVISGERKREEIEAGAEYLRMERVGKFLRKFKLPENANTNAVSSVYQHGVLTVTVQKKKQKSFKVQIGPEEKIQDISGSDGLMM